MSINVKDENSKFQCFSLFYAMQELQKIRMMIEKGGVAFIVIQLFFLVSMDFFYVEQLKAL